MKKMDNKELETLIKEFKKQEEELNAKAEPIVVTLTFNRKDNPIMYNRVKYINDKQKYFAYLMKLDELLNGTDQELILTQSTKVDLDMSDKNRINDEIDAKLVTLREAMDKILASIPNEFRIGFSDEYGEFVPDDEHIFSMSNLIDSIIALRKEQKND